MSNTFKTIVLTFISTTALWASATWPLCTELRFTRTITAAAEEVVVEPDEPLPLTDLFKTGTIEFREDVLENGCYLAATGYKDAMLAKQQFEKRARWARIMYVDVTETTGHAVCVFFYDGRWRAYDNLKGTVDLGEFDGEPTPSDVATKISHKYGNAKWFP